MDLRWLRHHWFYLLALVGLYFVCRQGQSWPLVIGMLVVYVVAATLVIHWQYVNWLSDAAPKTLPYWMLWSILGVGLVCVVVGFLRGWLGESRLVAWLLFPGIILSYLSAGWLMVRARSQASSSMQRRIGLWSTAICVLATGGGLLALATVDKPPKAAALVAFGLLAAPVGISLLAERAVDFFRTQWQTHARRVACTMLGGTAVAVGVATWVGALHDELWLTVALLALAALIVAMVSGTLADVFVVLGVIALIGVTPQSEPVHTVAPKSRVLVALGDSYMSGEGGDTYFEGTDVGGVNQCRRAPTAWAVQAGQRYFDDTVFLACSGARTYNVRHDTRGAQIPEPRRQDGELGTQLDQWVDLSKSAGYEAGLVVVSIGGNDAGFSTVGKVCGAPGSCDTPEMNHWFIDELPQVRKELTSTFQEVRDTFPKTPIAVTAYPDPIYGSKPCADLALTSGDVRFIKNFLTKLNETVHAATQAAGVAYIDGTQDALAKAGAQLCDPVNGSRPGVNFVGLRSVSGLADQRFNPMNWIHNSFHPNERGHAALLRVFDRWWVTTGRTLQAPGPVSDSAAVDGRLITPQCDLVGDGVDVPRCRSNADRWMVQKLARSATPILALTLLVVGPAWLASAAFFGWRRARRT